MVLFSYSTECPRRRSSTQRLRTRTHRTSTLVMVLMILTASAVHSVAPILPIPARNRLCSTSHERLMAYISVTTPSSEAAAEMGIREWPQQLKQGEWQEFVAEGNSITRYILDGSGSVQITDEDSARTQKSDLTPGTLIEVTGAATLTWTATKDLIILTPGFEESGLLLGVAVAVIAIFAALLGGIGF